MTEEHEYDESELTISVSFRIPFAKIDQPTMGFGADVSTTRKATRRENQEISFGTAVGEALRPMLPWLDGQSFADCLIDALFDSDGLYGELEESQYCSSGERHLKEHIQGKHGELSTFILDQIKKAGEAKEELAAPVKSEVPNS